MTPPNSLTPAQLVRRAGFPVNPPATEAALQELAAAWGVELPDEVRALYLDHDGQPLAGALDEPWQPFTLLSAQEAADTEGFLEWYETELEQGEAGESVEDYAGIFAAFLPLWFDGNGNYAVYYLAGPLRGVVGEMNHEMPWAIAPAWRSLGSFYRAMTGANAETFEYSTDFPVTNAEAEDSTEDADGQATAFDYARSRFVDDTRPPAREFWGAAMLALCPSQCAGELAPLLEPFSDAEWPSHMIAETAKAMLERQGAAAVPPLLETLQRAIEQPRPALAYAYADVLKLLGAHASAEAEAALRQLAQHPELAGAGPQFIHALAEALAAQGYRREIRRDGTVRLSKAGTVALELPRPLPDSPR